MMNRVQKRGAAWIFALVMVFGLFAGLPGVNLAVAARIHMSARIHTGEAGDNITWRLDTRTGVLTLEGTGEMWDWEQRGAPWVAHMESITSIVIADGITTIGDRAFSVASNLTSVDMSSVITIGYRAFSWATSLTSIDMPNATIIGEGAFWAATSLTSIDIPSATIIGEGAFWMATSLASIDMPNVEIIGDFAFADARSLTSVYIPAGVTYIGWGAFAVASSLTEIRVAPGNMYYRDIDGVLFDYAAILLHTYPIGRDAVHYTIPDSATTVGGYSFYGARNLTRVYMPSVTTIGEGAFAYASGLASVYMPGATYIERFAFQKTTNLTSVDIPASVTYIGQSAFGQASSLTSATVRSRDTTFGPWVFGSTHPDFTIYGFPGSTAEAHAISFRHNFVPLDDDDSLSVPSSWAVK